MGLNMWLPSVFEFHNHEQVDRATAGVTGEPVERRAKDPVGFMTRMYDAYRATGGYYREGYNGRGLLSLMGMSWFEIMDRLTDRSVLPVEHARFLLAELEAKPFTKEMLFGECAHRDATPMQRTGVPPLLTGYAALYDTVTPVSRRES